MSDLHECALFNVAPEGKRWIIRLGEQAVSRHPSREDAVGHALGLMTAMLRQGWRSGVLWGDRLP